MADKREIQNFYDDFKAGGFAKYTSAYEHRSRLISIYELADLKNGELVLEVGCGIGWMTMKYASTAEINIIGVDISGESILEARNIAIKKDINNLAFAIMDAEELGFQDNTFDCIICSEVLEHLLHPEEALKEMKRVLKPTGRIVITTPNTWNLHRFSISILKKIGKRPREQIYDKWISPLKINKMVRNAGMTVINRKGTYYVPPLIPVKTILYNFFARISTFIEKWNQLPYLGLYQICLLYSTTPVSLSKRREMETVNICQVVLSEGWGGAETMVYQLSKHLVCKGQNVSIILNQEIIKYYNDLQNIRLFNIGSRYSLIPLVKSIISPGKKENGGYNYTHRNRLLNFLIYVYPMEFLNYIYTRRIKKQVKQFLSDNQIDVLHLHMAEANFFISEMGNCTIPVIATPHGEHFLRGDVTPHLLMRPITKWNARRFTKALNKAIKVIQVSHYMLNDYNERNIIKSVGATVIHNGINVSEIQASSDLTLKLEGDFNLLFPGGTKIVKGGDILISALPELKFKIPGIHLYIALDVPQNHKLRKMAMALGVAENITFTGFLAPEEYRKLLNSVDLLVLPSRREAFPIVCLEAMALGKPIVASKVGGIPELIKEGRNGLLIDHNPEQIAGAIIHLWKDEKLRREMGQNNLQDIVSYDWNLIADQYIEVYKEVLKAR